MRSFLFFLCLSISAHTALSQTSFTWNGITSTDWNTATNWTPAGIPGPADHITIVTGSNVCVLPANAAITNITLNSGQIDLGGFTLTVNGTAAVFNAGTIQNGIVTVSGSNTATFGNGPVVMNCKVNITSASIYIKNAVFQDSVTITKTGPATDNSNGNNVFNGALIVNNAGLGSIVFGNNTADQFYGNATFNNTGSGNMYIAQNNTGHVFNGLTTFNNAPAGNTGIYVGWNSSLTTFNGNIIVTSTSGQGVQFGGGNSSASVTLAAGNKIIVGPAGFSAGTLLLRQFTQTGGLAQDLTLTGTSRLTFGPASSFDGDIIAEAPSLFLNGSIFNGTTSFTKTGPNGDYNAGGNSFNGICSIINTGPAFWVLGNSNPDAWNNDVTFTNKGGDRILPAWNAIGNQFNGNIYINCIDTAVGIQFCGGNSTATAILAAGKTIQAGSLGLTAGYLYLKQFTQLGNTPIDLVGTGASTFRIGPDSEFGGQFTATAPNIWAQGAIYHSAATFTKTGGSNNHNEQRQNIFHATCTINQQSNSGYFMLGYNSNDLFNDDLIVTSSGTGGIYLGRGGGTSTPTLAAGKTIVVGGAGFSAGFLSIRAFTQLGTAPVNLDFTGATTYLSFSDSSVVGGNLFSNTPGLYFSGAIFKGKVNAIKTGTGNEAGSGRNIFEDSVTLINAGSGYLALGNGAPDTFYRAASFTSNGSSYIGLAWNSADNLFNGNITISSTGSSTGINFCSNGTSTATLTAGNTILVDGAGFATGSLYLRRFTQLGTETVDLPLSGTTALYMGPSLLLGGNVTAISPSVYLNSCTFNGSTDITKTGTSGDYSPGGNIFNGVCSITNTGSSFFLLGNTDPDIWNDDVTFTNSGSERILPAWASTGNEFHGNIYLNTSGSAQGIRFCGGNSTATAILAAGKTIEAGSGGLNAGNLILKQFTQLGNAPVNITMASTATSLQFGPAASFGGDITSSSPGLLFNGCVFNGTTTCTKTGATYDASTGSNVFYGVAVMENSGSGYLLFGNGNPDQFKAAAIFNNTGTSNIYVAHNSTGNVFEGITTFSNTPAGNTGIYVSQNSAGTIFNNDIVVGSASGQGVQFCGNAAGSATLASGYTISAVPAGFSAGTLLLRQFTQAGATPQHIELTGTSTLTFGPLSSFGGQLTALSPGLLFNGCVFNGTTICTKTGVTNDASSGNNIFNGVATMNNTGSGYLMFGNGNPDQFKAAATFSNTGTSNMYVAHNSAGNVFTGVATFNNTPAGNTGIYISQSSEGTTFNNNIVVTSTNGQGIQFCNNSSGSVTLSPGNTINIGPAGFSAGTLLLRQFTQAGATPQHIELTGTSTLTFGPLSSFGGSVTTISPSLYLNGCFFNATVNCTKTGATNDNSVGNNIFNSSSIFNNTGTGYLLMTNNSSDAYNGDVSFVQTGTGRVYPNYNNNSTYAGNLTISSPSSVAITLGANNGTATFSGSAAQSITTTAGTPAPTFTRFILGNTGSGVTLSNTAINISKELTLTSGLLHTTTSNILTMLNGAIAPACTALSTSYINGPMQYQKSNSGASTLRFPIGNNADCRPVTLTVNHTNGTLYIYQAQLFNASAAALGYTLPPSVDAVSKMHYYTINRYNASFVSQPTAGLSGSQTIEVCFGDNDVVKDGHTLTIVKNTSSALTNWFDIGGTGAPAFSGGASLTGSIISTSVPNPFTSFSTFALANISGGMNVLPAGLLYFDAKGQQDKINLNWATSSESGNSYFTIEKSRDGNHFIAVQKVATKAINGNSSTTLQYSAVDASPYSGVSYYRLKQTDISGKARYSRTVFVNLNQKQAVAVYPNPSRGMLYVTGLGVNERAIVCEWFDVSGKLLARQTAAASNGMARLDTDLGNGVYFIKFGTADGSTKLQQVIITR